MEELYIFFSIASHFSDTRNSDTQILPKNTHGLEGLCLVWSLCPAAGRASVSACAREIHLSLKCCLASATLYQGWRLDETVWAQRSKVYQITWYSPQPLGPTQQHPIMNKSSRKEAFVIVYMHSFSFLPLIYSSGNWCTLKLKQRAWQVMVSVITAQISSARAPFLSLVSLCAIVETFSQITFHSDSESDSDLGHQIKMQSMQIYCQYW